MSEPDRNVEIAEYFEDKVNYEIERIKDSLLHLIDYESEKNIKLPEYYHDFMKHTELIIRAYELESKSK